VISAREALVQAHIGDVRRAFTSRVERLRAEITAPPPLLHGAVWRTRGAEEGAFGTVGYPSTILRYVRV